MISSLKVIFAGTPAFAETALRTLLQSHHSVVAVYTRQDKPAGRGLKLTASPVKQLALQSHIPVYQPTTLRSVEEQEKLAALNADVMVVAAYGMILPKAVLTLFPRGCINIHPSLLPRWRGAAPIPRTIHAGDTETGVTIMQMDEGLDTGPILSQVNTPVLMTDTAQTLHDRLAVMGGDALIETLNELAMHSMKPIPQDDALSTYASKMSKEEALIDWARSAKELSQSIRAFNPWPVSHTRWQGQPLRIFMAEAITSPSKSTPGTLLAASEQGLDVATGEGTLRITSLQLPGAKVISVADFYHAHQHALLLGQPFES